MSQLEVIRERAIEGEEEKPINTTKVLELLSGMGVRLRPGVAPEKVFTRDLGDQEPAPFPSRRRDLAVRERVAGERSWEPFTYMVRLKEGEAAEGRAQEAEEVLQRVRTERIAIGEARRELSRVVTEAHYTDKDYVIERHGKPEAAIIGIRDYERLQRLENERDVRLLQKAKRKAQEFVSVEQLVNDYEKRFGEKISTPSEEG